MRKVARRAFDFYWGTGIADDVPALTYYLVLSLAPVALGLAALEALLLSNTQAAINVADGLNRFLPDAAHADIRNLVLGTRDNSPVLLAIAMATMLWTTSGAIGVIERCESRILECDRHSIVAGRLRNMALGAGIAIMVLAASTGAPVIGDVADALNLRRTLPGTLLVVVNTLGSIIVFALLYHWAPRAAQLARVPAGRRAGRDRHPGRALDRRPLLRGGRGLCRRPALPAAGGDRRRAVHHRPRDAGGRRDRREVRAAPPG